MTTREQGPIQPYGFAEALISFEGTPFAGFIAESLTQAGIDPSGYDPRRHGHDNYMGLLASTPDGVGERTNPSPVITALERSITSNEITLSHVDQSQVGIPPWSMYPADGSDPYQGNAWRTSKLSSFSLMELRDAQTGSTLGYLAGLSSDGGRQGYALLSINDVVTKDTK